MPKSVVFGFPSTCSSTAWSTGACGLASDRPLLIKPCPVNERLLRPGGSRGERGVEVGALERLSLGKSFTQERCEAPDEGVPGTAGIDGRNRERRDEFLPLQRGEERPRRAQGDDDPLQPLLE